jgi:hypothetical protein
VLRHTFITNLINRNFSVHKIVQYSGTTIEALEPYYNLKAFDLYDINAFLEDEKLEILCAK